MPLNQGRLMVVTARISLAFYFITWACWMVIDITVLNASNFRQIGDSLIMMPIQALLFLFNAFVILGCLWFNLKYFGLLMNSPKALIAEPAKLTM